MVSYTTATKIATKIKSEISGGTKEVVECQNNYAETKNSNDICG